MKELANSNIILVYELIWQFLHALKRPVIQIQLLGIIIILTFTWLISQRILIQWRSQFPTFDQGKLNSEKLFSKYFTIDLLRFALTPVLSLILVSCVRFCFVQLGWRAGIFTVTINILWTFIFYRSFLLICYKIFPSTEIGFYRRQFFAPLFFLFAIGTIFNLLTDIKELSQVEIIRLFDTPVTIGTIFLMTVGIYFWVIGISLVEQIFFYIFFLTGKQKTGAAQATSILLRCFLIGIGIVLFFGYIGFNPTVLAAISGGLSVGVGFGLQEFISNFISGIGLLFEGSLRPGDMVQVEGEVTIVEKVGIRAATVRTFDNIEKIVPNQHFFTSVVTTYTGSDRVVRVIVPVRVNYQCDPEKVINILLDLARRHPLVQTHPKPYVHLMGYGDSSVDYRLSVFINNPEVQLTVKSDLYRTIWKALAHHKIKIPFPRRDLYIRHSDNNLG